MSYLYTDKRTLHPVKSESVLLTDGQPVISQNFQHINFKFIGGTGITFHACDFSFARLNDVYLRKCTFENCKFVGAKISDSNLRDSIFNNCVFNYIEFKNTEVLWEEVLKNLPMEANISERLLRNLRKNYEGLGDRRSVKLVIEKEIEASNQYFREALERKQKYYIEKYNQPGDEIRLRKEHYIQQTLWVIWGCGEFPSRIFISSAVILAVSAAVLAIVNLHLVLPLQTSTVNYFDFFWVTLKTFIGIPLEETKILIPDSLKLFITLFRFVVLSLFVSTLTRRYSWR